MISSSQLIVLAKSPYRESALLLNGISPDYGRLSLVLHGALKSADGKMPAADLYRELDVEFKEEENSTLYTATTVEVMTAFDTIADHTRSFLMAGKISSFLLKNLAPGVPQPYTYDALRSILARLAAGEGQGNWTLEQCAVVLKTAFLYENGLLPEGTSEQQRDFLENLVAAGIDNSELPECAAGYWTKLNGWLNALLDYHQLARA